MLWVLHLLAETIKVKNNWTDRVVIFSTKQQIKISQVAAGLEIGACMHQLAC